MHHVSEPRLLLLPAVAVPHQVAAVPDLMDIAVGEQEDFVGDFEEGVVGDFKEGVVVVVGEDDAFGRLLAADEVLYPFHRHRGEEGKRLVEDAERRRGAQHQPYPGDTHFSRGQFPHIGILILCELGKCLGEFCVIHRVIFEYLAQGHLRRQEVALRQILETAGHGAVPEEASGHGPRQP